MPPSQLCAAFSIKPCIAPPSFCEPSISIWRKKRQKTQTASCSVDRSRRRLSLRHCNSGRPCRIVQPLASSPFKRHRAHGKKVMSIQAKTIAAVEQFKLLRSTSTLGEAEHWQQDILRNCRCAVNSDSCGHAQVDTNEWAGKRGTKRSSYSFWLLAPACRPTKCLGSFRQGPLLLFQGFMGLSESLVDIIRQGHGRLQPGRKLVDGV